MQRKKQACLPLSLMHSERTGGKQATNLVKENEKKQICISVKEECGVWSSVPANSSGIWVAGALAAWLGAMQTVDDTPEPAQRLTKLKFPKPSRNVMGTEEARSSWKAPRCWENGTSILTSSLKPSPSIYWAKASQRQDLVALFRSELPVEVCIRRFHDLFHDPSILMRPLIAMKSPVQVPATRTFLHPGARFLPSSLF
ncbi:uncharacterized protein [Anser cygnoides]|uniref:uncharacterized protein isoform X3 n=1 Tax=Anser cygnoides TaxID=8845 RepID=UPI0006710918